VGPLGAILLGGGDRAIEEHLQGSGDTLGVGSSCSPGPCHQLPMHPCPLFSGHDTRWMTGVREFADDVHHRATAKVGLLGLLDHPVEQVQGPIGRWNIGHRRLEPGATHIHASLHVGRHEFVLATEVGVKGGLGRLRFIEHPINADSAHPLGIEQTIGGVDQPITNGRWREVRIGLFGHG